MNKYKLKILKIVDKTIRFTGLIGGSVLALIGMLLKWWTCDVAINIYIVIFIISLLYCIKYNGSEWTS